MVDVNKLMPNIAISFFKAHSTYHTRIPMYCEAELPVLRIPFITVCEYSLSSPLFVSLNNCFFWHDRNNICKRQYYSPQKIPLFILL